MHKIGDRVRIRQQVGTPGNPNSHPKGEEVTIQATRDAVSIYPYKLASGWWVSESEIEAILPYQEHESVRVRAADVQPGDWLGSDQVVSEVTPRLAVDINYEGGGSWSSLNPDSTVNVRRPVQYVNLRVRRSTAESYADRRDLHHDDRPAIAAHNDVIRASKEALEKEEPPVA